MGQTWWRASWGSRGRRTTSCWPNCPMSSVAVRWPPWPPWRRWRIADARRVRRSSAADASAGLARRLVRRAPRAPWLVSRPAVNRRRLRPTVPLPRLRRFADAVRMESSRSVRRRRVSELPRARPLVRGASVTGTAGVVRAAVVDHRAQDIIRLGGQGRHRRSPHAGDRPEHHGPAVASYLSGRYPASSATVRQPRVRTWPMRAFSWPGETGQPCAVPCRR